MPLGTAIWLIENTALTFEQIANFCGLHLLEVQALADEQIAAGMEGIDPVNLGQLTRDEIERCTKDPNATMTINSPKVSASTKPTSKRKYTPLFKRRERPDAIAWLVKFYPEISDSNVCSLVSTTKSTVQSIRNRSHPRMGEIHPKDPVLLGFCTQVELDAAVAAIKSKTTPEADSTV
jgi:hypothetical protein